MSVLLADKISKSYGPLEVLREVSLVLQEGERVALLGINGSGKSTLAKILAGAESADSGSVQIKKGARVAYFSQEPNFPADKSAREIVRGGLGRWNEAMNEYEEIGSKLARTDGETATSGLLAEQTRLSEEIEQLGGWERGHQVGSVMGHLGVLRPDAQFGELSGGEKRRVALARLVIAQPDIAILDEPTNHLDVETIEWLEEEFTERFRGALIFITHDRYMLDRVAERIVELDDSQTYTYRGGWDAYLEAKAERQALAERTEANRQNFLRTELEWLRRSPQARTTKQKARVKRAEAARDVERKKTSAPAKLQVEDARTGRTILDVKDLQLSIGENQLISGLTMHMAKGDRVGIIGKNGAGKTSFLRAILGELPIAGGSITLGETMKIGYFQQSRANLDPEKSIFENVIGNRGDIRLGKDTITPHAYLQRFQFSRGRSRDPVKLLSGGQRARVALAKMLVDPVNLLILDEPTNDLDVATLSSLEEMLIETTATALVVTHDRYFLDRVANSVLAFEGKGRVVRYASAEQARRARGREDARAAEDQDKDQDRAGTKKAQEETSQSKKPGAAKKKLTYGERIEHEGILDRVAEAEAEVERLEAALAEPDNYSEALAEELAVAQGELEKVILRWEYLESKNEE